MEDPSDGVEAARLLGAVVAAAHVTVATAATRAHAPARNVDRKRSRKVYVSSVVQSSEDVGGRTISRRMDKMIALCGSTIAALQAQLARWYGADPSRHTQQLRHPLMANIPTAGPRLSIQQCVATFYDLGLSYTKYKVLAQTPGKVYASLDRVRKFINQLGPQREHTAFLVKPGSTISYGMVTKVCTTNFCITMFHAPQGVTLVA